MINGGIDNHITSTYGNLVQPEPSITEVSEQVDSHRYALTLINIHYIDIANPSK